MTMTFRTIKGNAHLYHLWSKTFEPLQPQQLSQTDQCKQLKYEVKCWEKYQGWVIGHDLHLLEEHRADKEDVQDVLEDIKIQIMRQEAKCENMVNSHLQEQTEHFRGIHGEQYEEHALEYATRFIAEIDAIEESPRLSQDDQTSTEETESADNDDDDPDEDQDEDPGEDQNEDQDEDVE